MKKRYLLWAPALALLSLLVIICPQYIANRGDITNKYDATDRILQSAEENTTALYMTMHYDGDVLTPKAEEQYYATRNTDYVLTEQEESYLAGRFDSDILTEREERFLASRFDGR